jgi:hypothetical protein
MIFKKFKNYEFWTASFRFHPNAFLSSGTELLKSIMILEVLLIVFVSFLVNTIIADNIQNKGIHSSLEIVPLTTSLNMQLGVKFVM